MKLDREKMIVYELKNKNPDFKVNATSRKEKKNRIGDGTILGSGLQARA